MHILQSQPHKPTPQTSNIIVNEIEDEQPVCSDGIAEEMHNECEKHHADHVDGGGEVCAEMC